MDIKTRRLILAFNASGMTQAELCNKSGITKGALSSYLSGKYFPKQKALEALSDALNVSINYLMGYEEEMEAEKQAEAILMEKIRKLSPTTRAALEKVVDALLEGEEDGN